MPECLSTAGRIVAASRVAPKKKKAPTTEAQRRVLAAVAAALPAGAACGRTASVVPSASVQQHGSNIACGKQRLRGHRRSAEVRGSCPGTLSALAEAPPVPARPLRAAPLLAPIRESEELAAQWASSSCAIGASSSSDSEEEDSTGNWESSSNKITPARCEMPKSDRALAVMQRYKSGKQDTSRQAQGLSGLGLLLHGTSLDLAGCPTRAILAPSPAKVGKHDAEAIARRGREVEVVGSMMRSDSSSSSSSSSSS